jgi:hypothetical protein
MAHAQETVFNVPSPDVLERGKLYLETDHYLVSMRTGGERDAFFLLRGVGGVGASTEVGLNLGASDYIHPSQPFVDLTVKWRPWQQPFGGTLSKGRVGAFVGDNFGAGIRNDVSGHFRNFAYAAGFLETSGQGTRLSLGPYFATHGVFADRGRFGAQATFEQTIPGARGLKLAADWFSGDGAYATAGLIWTTGRSTFYAGYGLANQERSSDLVTVEYGIVLF